MRAYKLVVVSNRLPVSVVKHNGKLEYEAGTGGLATAMSSLKQDDKIWLGWPGIASDDLTDGEMTEIETELVSRGFYPVFLTKKQVELFYEGYSNDTLWPLFHYFQSLTRHNDEYWTAYQEVNQLFAKAAAEVAAEIGSVWVHDYHLMTMPSMLRKLVSGASIGFFLHIPFPSFEIYRLLPQRKELLQGLLGADLIGFHVYDYARHFLSSCLRLLGIPSHQGLLEYQGRTVKVDAYPIGIDYEKFTEALVKKTTKSAITTIEKSNKNQKIIISVDRLDYTKGIAERLDAFRLLLDQHPEYIGSIRLLMVEVPSRTEVETYMNLRDNIEQMVSRINGMYGTVDWAPISYQFQNLPFDEIVGLFAAADVALVTPIRDGMNLVAKEYVASKQHRPGVLILSEMTGAFDELPESIGINPTDTHSVADAMHTALTMPKREQQRRLGIMQRRLKTYSVQAWGADFMQDLAFAGGTRQMQHKKRMTTDGKSEIFKAYKSAKSRLIILDYDGTLQDFVSSPRPSAAKPSRELINLLKKLSNDGNRIAIVSGRPQKTLERWFRSIDVMLAAEHGAHTRYDDKWTTVDIDFNPIKKQLRPLLEKYVSRTAGSEIEEKDFAIVWHYRNVAPELAFVRANELRRELTELITDESIGVFGGNKIVEIKPRAINKGTAAAELDAIYQPDFVLSAGDDYTDEDMFAELGEDAFTIKVGPGDTQARYQLANVEQMIAFLEELAEK